MGNEAPGGDHATMTAELGEVPPRPPAPVSRRPIPFGLSKLQAIIATVTVALVLVLAVSTIWLAVTLGNYAAAVDRNLETIADLTAGRDTALEAATSERKQRIVAERTAKSLTDSIANSKSREAELTALEAAAAERSAGLDAREAAVKAREDAALANVDWWVPQVRECLARPGSYRMASATEGSLGRDVSCMSG